MDPIPLHPFTPALFCTIPAVDTSPDSDPLGEKIATPFRTTPSMQIPAMVLWEGISTGSPELISKALYRGIWAQALVFLITLSVSWGVSPGTRPDWAFENSTGQTVGLVMIVVWVIGCALAILTVRGGLSIVIALHLGIIPLGVEVYESVLLFTRDSSTFITYVLAVLDLVIVAPALVLVPVYFRFLRDEDRRRHAP